MKLIVDGHEIEFESLDDLKEFIEFMPLILLTEGEELCV